MLFSYFFCLVGLEASMVSAGPIKDFLNREIAFSLSWTVMNSWSR